MLTVGSLFSGIGGIDLGLERAGFDVRWQVEIDEYAVRVLDKHWPNTRRYGDVRDLSGSSLEAVDVICGGFPCQPVSLAGKRQAQADPRWLWPHFARLVDEIRPRYVIVENVPGLYSLGGAEVVTDLATIGFDAEWHSISAATFGAPISGYGRSRFILLAFANSNRLDRPRISRKVKQPMVAEFAWDGGIASEYAGTTSDHWAIEPNVGRVANGVPARMDRLRGLGNGVIPQLFEWVGDLINDHNERVNDAHLP